MKRTYIMNNDESFIDGVRGGSQWQIRAFELNYLNKHRVITAVRNCWNLLYHKICVDNIAY